MKKSTLIIVVLGALILIGLIFGFNISKQIGSAVVFGV